MEQSLFNTGTDGQEYTFPWIGVSSGEVSYYYQEIQLQCRPI